MVYLLQTPQSVAFCNTVDELYSALSNRPIASAMLHSSDNFEPLRHLAGISQHRIIECNADDKNPITQISLPSIVAETVCLKTPVLDDSVALNLMPLVQTGEWAISALNGFCTAPSNIELCQLLAGGALAYPVARWLESSHETVVIAARQNTSLIVSKSVTFNEREKRRAASLPEGYENFQMTRIAMGW